MTDLAHYESTLEKLITEHLVEHDWHQGDKSNYNREIGLDLAEMKLFISSTRRRDFVEKVFRTFRKRN
jgi:hypothetical protein